LNGEAVPVKATVTVTFNSVSLVTDQQGNLTSLTGASPQSVLDDATTNKKIVVITIPPQVQVPFGILELALRVL